MRVWINPTDVGRHHEVSDSRRYPTRHLPREPAPWQTRPQTNDDKREQICRDIDNNGFDWQIWAVAASGFFTDSYNLFATNVILPCLAYVYWPDDNSDNETRINIVTLVGSCLGQLIFGFLADRYGRRKLYGFELIVVIFGTLGVAQSSAGYNGSMSILSWMMFWRFFVGLGIGAEYPLSAVITAE
jgi:MFS transporter, PHS family, inorganic phosphate transporter